MTYYAALVPEGENSDLLVKFKESPGEVLLWSSGYHKGWEKARTADKLTDSCIIQADQLPNQEYFSQTYKAMLRPIPNHLKFRLSVSNINDGMTITSSGTIRDMIGMFREYVAKDKGALVMQYAKRYPTLLDKKMFSSNLPETWVSFGLEVPSLEIVVAGQFHGAYAKKISKLPSLLRKIA